MPSQPVTGQASTAFNAGGEGAEGELVTSVVTGNPHTDLAGAAARRRGHPKGEVPYNVDWGDAVDRTADAQLLHDATDARGRCHDSGTLGVSGAPQGISRSSTSPIRPARSRSG